MGLKDLRAVERLDALVEAYRRGGALEYGIRDCATFWGECFQEVAGYNPFEEFVGGYDCEVGAMRLLHMRSCTTMVEACLPYLKVKPLLAVGTGDFVTLHNTPRLMSPMIVLRGIAFGYGATGVLSARSDQFAAAYEARVKCPQ